MRKIMFLLLSILTVYVSMAADVSGSFGKGSTYATSTVGNTKTLTLNVVNAGEFATWYSTLNNWSTTPKNTDLQSCNKVVVTGNLNADDLAAIGSCLLSSGMLDLYGAKVSDAVITSKMPEFANWNHGEMSVLLPKASTIDLLGFAYTNDWNNLAYKFKSVMKYGGATLSYTGKQNGLFATDAAAAIAAYPEIKDATALNIEMTSLNNTADLPTITDTLTNLTSVSIVGNKTDSTRMNGDLIVSGASKLERLSVTNTIINGKVEANEDAALTFLSLNGCTISAHSVSATGDANLAVVMVPQGTTTNFTGSPNVISANEEDGVFTLNIMQPGQLKAAMENETVKQLVSEATTFAVSGHSMNAEDFSALASVPCATINLSQSAFSADVTALSLTNSNVKYLIMPDGTDKTLVNAATFAGCTALQTAFAGTYTEQSDHSEWITEITAYVKVPNTLRAAMEQDPRIKVNEYDYHSNKIVKATLSGNLMPDDLAMECQEKMLDADGHLSYTVNGSETDLTGTTRHEKLALAHANLQYLDLTDAVFAKQTDMNFSLLVAADSLATLKLPVSPSMTLLPGNTLNNFAKLTELCVPYNYQTIGEGAFYNSPILHMTTTDAEGNVIDNGARTLTLSANLKEVRTVAFNLGTDVNSSPTDVYVLAKQAPLCAKNAFTQGMLYGWGGYSPTVGAITREDYDRFAILHFPDDVTLTEAKNYTDLTREFSQPDANLATDGNGKIMMWPTQSEYNRSIEQANTGYIWNAWKTDRKPYTNAITTQGSGAAITQEQGDDMWSGNGSPANMTYDMKYIGWHQFVLAYTRNYTDPVPQWNFCSYRYNDWYTICVPYDMTKEDLLAFFGTTATTTTTIVDKPSGKTITLEAGDKLYPEVRTLTAVTRSEPTITLRLSKNLTEDHNKFDYVSSLSPAYSTYAAGEPVIKAGYPYLIKPALSDAELALARDGARSVAMSNEMMQSKLALDATLNTFKPKLDYTVKAYDSSKAEIPGYTYTFSGTFVASEIPAASGYYYLGHSKSKDLNQFFRQTKLTALPWNAYSCVVGAKASIEMKRNDDTSDGSYFDMLVTGNVIDDFASGAKPNFVMAFDDDETTGITELPDNHVPTAKGPVRIYSINGQYVGDTVNGLPAGIYIVNGKKLVVK